MLSVARSSSFSLRSAPQSSPRATPRDPASLAIGLVRCKPHSLVRNVCFVDDCLVSLPLIVMRGAAHALRVVRFVRPAQCQLDHAPQFLLPLPVAMVHGAGVGPMGLLPRQRLRALLALEPRLSKPARRFARVDHGGASRGNS